MIAVPASTAFRPRPIVAPWALEATLHCDAAHPGFIAFLLCASSFRRAAIFMVLSVADWHHPEGVVKRLRGTEWRNTSAVVNPVAVIARALVTRRVRDLVKAVFGEVPGLLGVLHRLGDDPLPEPALYGEIVSILADPARRQQATVLRQLGRIDAQRLQILAALDPVFLVPGFVEKITTVQQAHDLTTAAALLRQVAPDLDDRTLAAMVHEAGGASVAEFVEMLFGCADRLPSPPIDLGAGFMPLDTGRKLVEASIRYWLGLRSLRVFAGILRGARFFWECPRHGIIVEAEAHGDAPTWFLAGLHGASGCVLSERVRQEIGAAVSHAGLALFDSPLLPSPWDALDRVASANTEGPLGRKLPTLAVLNKQAACRA